MLLRSYLSIAILLFSFDANSKKPLLSDAIQAYLDGDIEYSLSLFRPLLKNDPEAMYTLAQLYQNRKNSLMTSSSQEFRAFQLFVKGAELGHVHSMYMVAVNLKLGRGVKKNPKKAIFWLKKAADMGHIQANYDYALVLCKGMDGTAINRKAALPYLRLASENGHVKAQSLLGYMLMTGDGIDIDEEEGFNWITLAANNNDEIAKLNLKKLRDHTPTVVNYDQSKYWSVENN